LPVENDGSLAAPGTRTRRTRVPVRTNSCRPVTKAIVLQLLDTATAVVRRLDWRPEGSETRRGAPPLSRVTNASTWRLESPPTRLEAAERKPTQFGLPRKPPLTAAPHDGPLAGAPPRVRDIRRARPGVQGVPRLLALPLRRVAKTSLTPLVSPRTRSDASDS
jgi:hypothetical protein